MALFDFLFKRKTDTPPDPNVTEFIIAKNRSGPLDVVPLMFIPNSTKFVEVDTRHSE